MKHLTYISLSLALALLLVGCTPKAQDQSTTDTSQETTPENQTFTGSIKNILALGNSFTCTATVDGAQQTTYIKNGNFYSEATYDDQDVRVIVKDNCMWSWNTSETQGVNMCFDPEELEDSTEGTTETSIWDTDSETLPTDVDFTCQAANVDDSLFTPPAEIEFVELNTMLDNLPKPAASGATNIAPDAQTNLENLMNQLSPEDQQALQEALNQ